MLTVSFFICALLTDFLGSSLVHNLGSGGLSTGSHNIYNNDL